MTAVGWKKFRNMNLWQQDKGHVAEVKAFLEAIEKGGTSPISIEELAEVTQVSFDVMRAAETQEVVRCSPCNFDLFAQEIEPFAKTA